jgi:hypothetical protein
MKRRKVEEERETKISAWGFAEEMAKHEEQVPCFFVRSWVFQRVISFSFRYRGLNKVYCHCLRLLAHKLAMCSFLPNNAV